MRESVRLQMASSSVSLTHNLVVGALVKPCSPLTGGKRNLPAKNTDTEGQVQHYKRLRCSQLH